MLIRNILAAAPSLCALIGVRTASSSFITMASDPKKLSQLQLPQRSHLKLPKDVVKEKEVLVFGDIHGCFDELQELLHKRKYSPSTHVVLSVGDMVNKGPKSLDVLNWFYENRENGVYTVRGNHDDSMLVTLDKLKEGGNDDIVKPSYSYINDITTEVHNWATRLPYTIEIGDLLIVHAGIVPKLDMDQQTPFDMTRMRFVTDTPEGKYEPLQRFAEGAVQWATTWPGPQLIVFGHDAKQGLQEEPFALGLDTGCCYGKRLTCAVFESTNIIGKPKEDWYRLVHVKAHAVYEEPGTKPPKGSEPTEAETNPNSCPIL
ncbi:hypothetical protein SARC_01168 [Sphaeroforma arctica JP610]|uniref:Calcineurin-like phosphoesterase domain-containing protein n=1 Tax=Sphaeroforma arctica JP610 TaxID=667725 RepID=A0A0L0GCG6_9EUKA|nr:hypothetical protein SARC_01168 [Sphaeroforma arctica JP610]KNC86702.1 hypothetical protein SARC_01168 [Sphaeroforma arctica JP610]|eukprot:XP_014160604.1 hypothetical protein SARC_01168 [Sphaeroforma arctica JP610]